MHRSLLTLLPLVAFCLPALAGMPAGLTLGETEKEVLQKVSQSKDFAPLNDKARRKLEGNYSLNARVGGQQWFAHFVFDRRSKQLTQMLFVSDKAMQPNQYNKLLKSFYLFTVGHLRNHFKLEDALNLPEFGHASSLKTEEVFPLHAFPGEGITLTTGLWKAASGGIHLCFTVQPASNSAMGQTYTSNTTGKRSDWEDVPAFSSTEEGKAFMEETGLAEAPAPQPQAEEEEPEELPEEDMVDDTTEPARKTVSEALPTVEQEVLQGLILLEEGNRHEGLGWLNRAARSGNARAHYELGCIHAAGLHGLPANAQTAEEHFHKAALKGYALAMVRYGSEFPVALAELGFRAEDGKRIIQTAEEAGDSSPSGRFNYAIMLRYGYGVRKDVAKAVEMMQQLETEGDLVAGKLAEEWSE